MKRRFRGIGSVGGPAEPESRYDVVIIGAGIGGLVCANLLVREGLSVLLLEQHYMVGGYCSTFRRGGFTFDAATHFYPLLGNRETLTGRLLEELGVETGWVKMDPVDTFHFPDGSRFDVPADFETYRAALDEAFPEERESLDAFFKEVREVYLLGLLAYFRGREVARLDPYRKLSVKEVLDRRFRDEKLKLLLTADCPHWGSPPSRTSFVFDSMLRLSYFLGNYYPKLGSQAFADELAVRFEENGGHLMMSTRARRIEIEGGRASAVTMETTRGRIKGRRRVAAGTVVSNADLHLTLNELLPPEVVDPAFRAQVEPLRCSFPCFLSHIGLRGVTPEVLERAQGYYWNTWDPELVGRNGLRCKVFAPTLYEPRMAPEGKQIVILQKVLDIEHPEFGSWAADKAAVEAYVTDALEAAVPGIREQIEVQTSASAQTSWRFTLNTKGSMLGWEMSPDQLGLLRPDTRGPVPGLHLVGHWTRPGGGITPVIVSALRVAATVARGDVRGLEAQQLAMASASGIASLRGASWG